MAVEIPYSLIRRIQAATREEAGLPHYDPGDPALRSLATLQEAISGVDPDAPPYLRCRNCYGKLLRGLQTMVCVYCGSEQRKDGLPFAISFNSTAGCKHLLEALDLDGSEPVTLHTDSRDSGKTEGVMKAGLFLSDLLDLELVWPLEEKAEVQCSSTSNMAVPTQGSPLLNVSGIDLDNFFSEAKGLVDSDAFDMPQHVLQREHIVSTETRLSSESGSFGAFENILSKDKVQGSTEIKASYFGDSFADWDADFQSAGSENPVADSKPIDLFQGSLPNTINNLTDREFGFDDTGNDQQIASEMEKHLSMNDNWTPGEFWHTKDVKISDTADQMKTSSTADVFENKSNNFLVATEPPESTKLPSGSKKNDDDNDDSFDIWQDFTSSRGAPEASSDSWTQIGENSTLSNEHSRELNSQNQIDMLDDMEFGSFSQSGPPGITPVRNDFTDKKNLVDTFEDMEFGKFFQSGPTVLTEVKNDFTDKDNFHLNLTDKVNLTDNFEDMEFGGFLQSGPSKVTDGKNDSIDKNNFESDAPCADGANTLDGIMLMDGTNENFPVVRTEPVSANVDDLLSQMNDLSFMLEGNLSIFKRTENSDSIP